MTKHEARTHALTIQREGGAGLKPSNPKDAIGSSKVPLALCPAPALALQALAHANGGLKYGLHNYRAIGVRASIYVDAAMRHLLAWWNGEELDPEDGVPNLGAVLACVAILVDARSAGKLADDRPPSVDFRAILSQGADTVRALRELHKDRKPRHWTIADTEGP